MIERDLESRELSMKESLERVTTFLIEIFGTPLGRDCFELSID